MLPPEQDQAARRPIWDSLQEFWMDTDPGISLQEIAGICARSKYSIHELEQIFWNEVRPAVRFNLWSVAGEWAGFELNWLSARILRKHRFGRTPEKLLDPYANRWWTKLAGEIERT